jgi:hypothetical protein
VALSCDFDTGDCFETCAGDDETPQALYFAFIAFLAALISALFAFLSSRLVFGA